MYRCQSRSNCLNKRKWRFWIRLYESQCNYVICYYVYTGDLSQVALIAQLRTDTPFCLLTRVLLQPKRTLTFKKCFPRREFITTKTNTQAKYGRFKDFMDCNVVHDGNWFSHVVTNTRFVIMCRFCLKSRLPWSTGGRLPVTDKNLLNRRPHGLEI